MSRVPRVLVEPGSIAPDGEVLLGGEEARHLLTVLRRVPGDPVEVLDGRGALALGRIRETGRSAVLLDIESYREDPPTAGPELFLGILHSRAMDLAVVKAVEIGVTRFYPVKTERSEEGRKFSGRLSHLRRAARQALKQCGRSWEMEVMEPVGIEELVAGDPPAGFLADPEGESLPEALGGRAGSILVGPEGGLTSGEISCVLRAGWKKIRLGPNILRAETAAIAGAVLLVNRFFNKPD